MILEIKIFLITKLKNKEKNIMFIFKNIYDFRNKNFFKDYKITNYTHFIQKIRRKIQCLFLC